MGLTPAGSSTVPLNVVVAPPGHMATLHAMPVQPPPDPVPGHRLGTPPPPHAIPLGHAIPQSRAPPQPSPIIPQYWAPPAPTHVPFVQLAGAHTWSMPPPPHVPPFGHAPHGRLPPQPPPMVPPNGLPPLPQVSRAQPDFTQTPLVHAAPVGQLPQSSAWPQLSPTFPQNWVPPDWQAMGMQVGPPTQMLFSHVESPVQVGHVIFRPQQSPIVPQYCPPMGVQVTLPHALPTPSAPAGASRSSKPPPDPDPLPGSRVPTLASSPAGWAADPSDTSNPTRSRLAQPAAVRPARANTALVASLRTKCL